ncbi:ABC transporter ATP-binding protein [Conexibacter arvalis]|uniref:Putative ABC transport system ATP-binding protein n=1 Tax=Conexibacter arvalis TaxID=912552 RepID=A0A840I900_9ACTN|nr:ABC transporter ATP-binding protein [Conexibacter arvalis]MBB4660795.1 putative ABC transport system ATP-binding protein [Conexibacter arvalis]
MALRMEGVARSFRAGGETVRALADVTLAVERGELVALVGPSGSGKSTLLSVAAGFEAPDDGVVTWDGEPVPRAGAGASRWRRDTLGIVAQEPQLVEGMSIHRSVGLRLEAAGVAPSEAQRRGTRLLRELGLGDRLTHRPEQLSTGQRQRAALARALSTDPQLVLADEPTGSLDSQAGRALVELLRRVAHERRRAVLVATHDQRMIALADRALTLEDGVVRPAPRDATRQAG